MGEEHQRVLFVAERSQAPGVGDARDQRREPVDEHMAQLSGHFDPWQHHYAHLFGKSGSSVGGPDDVVFRENDTLNTALSGTCQCLMGEEIAVGRIDRGVGVHINEHVGKASCVSACGSTSVCHRQLYDPHVRQHARQLALVGSLVEDERQLDGSRHVEIVGDREGVELALRLVIDRDGALREAELNLEIDGAYAVIEFDHAEGFDGDEQLSLRMISPQGEAKVTQREDGDVDVAVTLCDSLEQGA